MGEKPKANREEESKVVTSAPAMTNQDEMYQCIVCLEVRLESHACTDCGAVVCKDCSAHCNNCPQCRGQKTKLQPNMLLKKMIAQHKMPCETCGQLIELADHESHKARCK